MKIFIKAADIEIIYEEENLLSETPSGYRYADSHKRLLDLINCMTENIMLLNKK